MNIFLSFYRMLGQSILKSMQDYPKLELVFVMIIVPLITACFRYWVTDNFLKESDESRLERLARGKEKLVQVGPEYFQQKNDDINVEMSEQK